MPVSIIIREWWRERGRDPAYVPRGILSSNALTVCDGGAASRRATMRLFPRRERDGKVNIVVMKATDLHADESVRLHCALTNHSDYTDAQYD